MCNTNYPKFPRRICAKNVHGIDKAVQCNLCELWIHIKACVCYFLFFHEMIALQGLWKMLFISCKKLILFSRYSNFCISVLPSFSPCRNMGGGGWGGIGDYLQNLVAPLILFVIVVSDEGSKRIFRKF